MRRLTTPSHVMSITLESERVQHTLGHGKADEPHYYHRSHTALVDHLAQNDEHLWENILDCCRCGQEFLDEHDLNDGLGRNSQPDESRTPSPSQSSSSESSSSSSTSSSQSRRKDDEQERKEAPEEQSMAQDPPPQKPEPPKTKSTLQVG